MQLDYIKKTLAEFPIVPEQYADRISDAYRRCSHVEQIERWYNTLARINKNMESSSLKKQIRSHCFELDVVDYLSRYKSIHRLVYEPTPIKHSAKNCDLQVCSEIGNYLIELKSFWPERSSRSLDTAYFPNHIDVDLDGPTYSDDFKIRRNLIEKAVKIEQKFANYNKGSKTVLGVPTGFYLDWARYFGFVHIYKFGFASKPDYLGEMSMHYINEYSICYEGLIDEFWSFHYTDNGIDDVSMVDAARRKRQPVRLSF